MKRIVADLVAGTHGENSLARRLKGSAVNVAVGESSGFPVFRIGVRRSQMRDEFLPDRLCDRRSVVLEPREPGTQGAFTRRADFVSDRVIVPQVERAQQGPERQSLEHERAEHDRERGQHDQVAKRKTRGQRQCCRQRDDAAHAGPRDDQTAANRRTQHRARRMKTEPAISPSDDGIEGHVPGDPDDDHGHEDGTGDGKVSPAAGGLEARPESGGFASR